jgi:ABC-type lipoprotein export system ATPase subunit
MLYGTRVTSPGGLRRIVVRGLFGLRNYDIDVDSKFPTVLTGSNGTGKSTLLRLVNAASTGDLWTLATAPLERLELHFAHMDPFRLVAPAFGESAEVQWGDRKHILQVSSVIAELPDWAMRVLQERAGGPAPDLLESLTASAQTSGVSFEEFGEIRDVITGTRLLLPEAPEWLGEMTEQFPVLFVTDQRLVVDARSRVYPRQVPPRGPVRKGTPPRSARLAVEAASSDIADQMRRVDTAYARMSQTQDRRFPRDVIAAMSRQEIVPLSDLQSLVQEVDSRRERLRQVGLLDTEQDFEPELAAESLERESVRPVIATFLRSALRKLEVLEDLSDRLRLFKSFLDQRFDPKQLHASRREGLRFLLPNGASIRPSQLSSGEQQMLVLAYEILFRAADGTLVIIDEPEISLHVIWQDTLIDSLIDMGTATRLQFLMATHSPMLLGSHKDLERSLDLDGYDRVSET